MPCTSRHIRCVLGPFESGREINARELAHKFYTSRNGRPGDCNGITDVMVYVREAHAVNNAKYGTDTWWLQVFILSPDQAEAHSTWHNHCNAVAESIGLEVIEIQFIKRGKVASSIKDWTCSDIGCAKKKEVRFFLGWQIRC